MNREIKRFLCKVLIAYVALACIMILVALRVIPAGMFSMIALDIGLLAANVCSCGWVMDKAITISGIPKKEAYNRYGCQGRCVLADASG